MGKLRGSRNVTLVALATLAIVLALNAPSEARGTGGHGSGGGHAAAAVGHHGFDGHHFDVHVPGRFGFGFAPVVPFYGYSPYYPPAYTEAPAYWYYCPSYGAYYPNVTSCPEAWTPVPAS